MTFRKIIKNCERETITNKKTSKGQVKEDPDKTEKVYGYVDVFKKMGDSKPQQMFPVTLKKIIIGRDHACQIRVSNTRVSRHQCAVVVSEEVNNLQIHLESLTSRATTVHSNKVILGLGDKVLLQHGDRFRVFDIEFRWRKYDPINEQGQLDWSRPIPVIRVTPPPTPVIQTNTKSSVPSQQPQQPQPKKLVPSLPILKLSSKSIQEQRRKSCPPTMSSLLAQQQQQQQQSRSKTSFRWSLRLQSQQPQVSPDSPVKTRNNQSHHQLSVIQQKNLNNKMNNKNMSSQIGDKRRGSTGGNVSSGKRRGSADYDMRKAVLQRSFRRAFKDKLQQGSLIDVDDSRFRRALEDLIVLSSAA